ncbi:MAG TPA: PEGA domain-containing protein, partial [Spirochaetia bacterium]|nr:PEGA domain-containing protein [Spirochaetia bacterium]
MLKNLFRRKDKEPIPDFKDVHVTLKPILGIRPGVYLTVLYGLIILALIFVAFFLEGILTNGTYYRFQSEPVQAGVWIDGEKVGVTPCEILVKKGAHTFTLKRPFYPPITIEKEVGSYLFSVPFFPKLDTVNVVMKEPAVTELAEHTYHEFMQWMLVKDFSTEYQYPHLLTQAAMSIYARPTEETYLALKQLLAESLPHIIQPEPARDYLNALLIVETKGGPFSPGSFMRLLVSLRTALSTNRALPFWLYALLPVNRLVSTDTAPSPFPPAKADLEKEVWFQKALTAYRDLVTESAIQKGAVPGPAFGLAGLTFKPVPAASYLMGKADDPAAILDHNYL